MKKFEIKSKKIKCGKYGYYKYPSNIETEFREYSFDKDGEYLLYTAILQYISKTYYKIFRKLTVDIFKKGDIYIFSYFGNKEELKIVYNIDNFYLDNNILYLFENEYDKILLERKIKLNKIK